MKTIPEELNHMLTVGFFLCIIEHIHHDVGSSIFAVLVSTNSEFDRFETSIWFFLDSFDHEDPEVTILIFEFGTNSFDMVCT